MIRMFSPLISPLRYLLPGVIVTVLLVSAHSRAAGPD
ncbi:MAG: hypothetical protein RL693_1851, partial [Verrucomicrobiota bacterium]